MQAADMDDARLEAERFLRRLKEMVQCRKPVTEEERRREFSYRRQQHSGNCPEMAAVRRASMDLTRALARMRRS